jgi:hypothetical protein
VETVKVVSGPLIARIVELEDEVARLSRERDALIRSNIDVSRASGETRYYVRRPLTGTYDEQPGEADAIAAVLRQAGINPPLAREAPEP